MKRTECLIFEIARWHRHKDVKRRDVADFVNEMQKKRLWGRVWRIIKKRGRR